ncbi:hypothetical protein BDN70DRAFT_907453 [Pholiota conissans]|uniref:F-box domain-containing protein n=1 Tax=Pholiota conissans TaxID=109636 RepID=A0A9P6CRC1_9AGAR|nr:hypothetical protein BDN70DRAFT_907453 [Pholiota conissans]
MGLGTLPYDLLLNIATYLDLKDVHALQLTCKSLYDASTTRPIYRKLANDLLRRCRALPLKGFQRLSDLSTESLIHSVNKASHYETAWRIRAPRPIAPEPYTTGINSHSNYMDVSPKGRLAEKVKEEGSKWYKIVSAPPGEEVDWLSPITSSYTLCATKSGKVVCWDVQSDMCLAEWNPGARWELWKCRVEFEERTVFFTMAKVLTGSYDDDRVMEFVLMRLTFSDGPSGESSINPPVFSRVTGFRTTGVVMNVFLLDPSERLLSAFIWVSTSNTIGLYALPDWNKKEYVFIDTGIECVMSSNWSCILYQQHIVIHCEESDAAYQHFYPLSLLRTYVTKLTHDHSTPVISRTVPPARTLKKRFSFPLFVEMTDSEPDLDNDPQDNSYDNSSIIPAPVNLDNPNPYPFPPWYPESAHFVRQWWPSLPDIPRVSCTVVLLAAHDAQTHRTRFVLAQHYFRVPLDHAQWGDGIYPEIDKGKAKETEEADDEEEQHKKRESSLEDAQDDALMHLWYVSTPFEVVRVFDNTEENDDSERPRPLVAVDFGHAVWVEYVETEDDKLPGTRVEGVNDKDPKCLRFVTFPPFSEEYGVDIDRRGSVAKEAEVRTLETPPELDLGTVETINIDQSQGAIILSDKIGRIFILCYE